MRERQLSGIVVMVTDLPELDGELGAVPVAVWSDGSSVHSVVVADQDHDHEYWVVRDGRVLARCQTLAAIAEWQSQQPGPPYLVQDSGEQIGELPDSAPRPSDMDKI